MMTSNKGILYLIPNVIADNTQDKVVTPQLIDILPTLSYFLVENVRTARRYLSSLKLHSSIESLKFEVLDKDTNASDLANFMKPVLAGQNVGVLSESGCPGVADPGALAASYAHKNQIKVVPLVGPSSVLLALMASGLNGQQFAFNGYLPIENKEAATAIRSFEKISRDHHQTQIFIETPYRNNAIFSNLVKNLSASTLLTIAINLTGIDEQIETRTINDWKKINRVLPKAPAVYLFLA